MVFEKNDISSISLDLFVGELQTLEQLMPLWSTCSFMILGHIVKGRGKTVCLCKNVVLSIFLDLFPGILPNIVQGMPL